MGVRIEHLKEAVLEPFWVGIEDISPVEIRTFWSCDLTLVSWEPGHATWSCATRTTECGRRFSQKQFEGMTLLGVCVSPRLREFPTSSSTKVLETEEVAVIAQKELKMYLSSQEMPQELLRESKEVNDVEEWESWTVSPHACFFSLWLYSIQLKDITAFHR